MTLQKVYVAGGPITMWYGVRVQILATLPVHQDQVFSQKWDTGAGLV